MRWLIGIVLCLMTMGCPDSEGTQVPAAGSANESVQACADCQMQVKVRLAKNFPGQIHSTYRGYVTAGSGLSRGNLYARLCRDAACSDVFDRILISTDLLLSSGFDQSMTISGMPIGSYYVQLMVDTAYSQARDGACAVGDVPCVGAFDLLQVATTSVELNNSELGDASMNPEPSTHAVSIAGAVLQQLPDTVVGHVYFPERVVPEVSASGPRIVVPHGDATTRTDIAEIDPTADEPVRRADGGSELGDICGIVPGSDRVHVVEHSGEDFAIIEHDTASLLPTSAEPVLVSTPTCSPDAIACFPDVPQTLIDVPSLPAPCAEHDVSSDGTADVPHFARAGWRHEDERTRVYRDDQEPELVATAGVFTGSCGGVSGHQAAIVRAVSQGERRTFVGNDDSISVFDAQYQLLGSIDTRDYGKAITDFAVSPDGQTLYAVPACKSDVQGILSSSTQSQASDRHRVVVLDLATDANSDGLPDLKDLDRDFDGDGKADGGIDLEFLHLKQEILDWCESCFGVLPPTAIVQPRIEVSDTHLFLRGNMATDSNVSGLGQMGDIAVFDLATGLGILYQDYQPWLHGPSGRWGIALGSETARTAGFARID